MAETLNNSETAPVSDIWKKRRSALHVIAQVALVLLTLATRPVAAQNAAIQFRSTVHTISHPVSAILASGVWTRVPKAQTSHKSSAWTANPALVAKLGPELKITAPGTGTYGIRPPRGFVLHQVNMMAMAGGGMIYMWMGPMQPDNTQANFTVTIGKDNSGMMPGMTSASFVRLEMSAVTMSHKNSQVSAMQQGTIHGLPFARSSWKGIGPRTGKMFQGIFYGEFVRPLDIMIVAKDEAPFSKSSMPLFNAAALTLHKY